LISLLFADVRLWALVSQAEIRPVKAARQCRAGQMGFYRHQQGRVARHGAEFRPRQFFHGVDQHRQPRHLAFSGTPMLGLLSHCLSRLKPVSPKPPPDLPTRPSQTRSPRLREKRSGKCDLVHKSSGFPDLNRRNDPKSTPTFVRAADRRPHRLCADRYQRRGRPDRADLPRPGLTGFEADAHGATGRQNAPP